jgi:enterobactin synthetase component D
MRSLEILAKHTLISSLCGQAEIHRKNERQQFAYKNFNQANTILSKCHHFFPQTIHNSVLERQYEYALARVMVFALLRELDCSEDLCWLGMQERKPIWPAGYYGSISHCKNAVAVLVKRHTNQPINTNVGIDLENIESQHRLLSLRHMCFTAREQNLLEQHPHGLVLGFCAKEALFKCLNPITQEFFDFKDAEITNIDLESQSLTLELKRNLGFIMQGSLHKAFFSYPTKAHLYVQVLYV